MMGGDTSGSAAATVVLTWRTPLGPATTSAQQIATAVSADERTIAWWAGWESGPLVHFVDAITGRELHRETCAALDLLPAGSGFLTVDCGWRRRDRRRGPFRLLAFKRVHDHVTVCAREVAPATSLVGAEPEGDRFVLFADGRAELRSWTAHDPLAAWQWYAPGVDWEAGCAWGVRSGRVLVISALDGSWARSIPSTWAWRVHGVGAGVLRTGVHGVRLFRPRTAVVTVLPPTSRLLTDVSVAGGGQVVRTVLDGKPRSFRVDLRTARVLDAPGDAPHLARGTRRLARPAVWHPTSDLVALIRRWPRAAVWTASGRFVCRLADGSIPRAWLGARDALLTVRRDGAATYLESWRGPMS